MMENSESKKSIFYMIVLILTLITMIIGATLAYYKLLSSQQEEGTKIYTGKLEINYIDGVYMKNPELKPMNTPNYDKYDGVYRNSFSVASSGTLDQTISLEIEIGVNEFSVGALKYILFNDKGEKITTGDVPKENKKIIASDMFLKSTGTAQYTLIIWLQNKNHFQSEDMGKRISAKINVHAKQIRY